MLGVECRDMELVHETEQVDCPIGETSGNVAVGEGQAAAGEAVIVIVNITVVIICREEMEGGVKVPARSEIGGRTMKIDVLRPPRVTDEMRDVPDSAREVLPQEIGARYG